MEVVQLPMAPLLMIGQVRLHNKGHRLLLNRLRVKLRILQQLLLKHPEMETVTSWLRNQKSQRKDGKLCTPLKFEVYDS